MSDNTPQDAVVPRRWMVNPLNWSWRVWIGLIVLILLAIPIFIRMAMLSLVPDIPEPFDLAEFCKWDVPPEENAFTDFRLAIKVRDELPKEVQDLFEANVVDDVINNGWQAADESVTDPLALHAESLEIWKRGAMKSFGAHLPPAEVELSTQITIIQQLRKLIKLGLLEQEHCLHDGRLDEALKWNRAVLRTGGHITCRGFVIQGIFGTTIHSSSARAIVRWSERPELTSGQLKSALADIRNDFQLYERPSSIAKVEYLSMRKALNSIEWIGLLEPVMKDHVESKTELTLKRYLYWIVAEPELSLRINKQILANQLQELDKPFAKQQKLIGKGTATLFDTDPATRQQPGQMPPTAIDRALQSSFLAKCVGSSIDMMRQYDLRTLARQIAMETVLAAQAYRRDHNEFPPTLESLVPDYLDAIPIDPCDRNENAMLYRREDPQKALVWSVGPDGVDNDGTIQIQKGQPPDVGFELK